MLAIAIGHELGLTENELFELEYAALLHDIGQLSLIDPIPGGSTLVVAPVERRRVAELGADVIKTTGVLDRVADIVARQADPYRRHREVPDDTLPIESRIIKAASAYDDLVGASASQEIVADALERLRLGMAYEYDPGVVETLTRLVAPGLARPA
jgi:response regulator RpfG family c-di-GMP phosphodiesterase